MVETLDPTGDAPGIVDYERPHAWPRALTELLDAHAEMLKAYERERARIDAICEEDISARINPPPNCYREQRDQVVGRADKILAGEQLLGFHCTRLANDEIADVRAHGLQLLSADFLQERICRRIKAGDIPESLRLRLLNEHQADDRYRQGCLCFVNMRSELKSESAVGRLFRSWGGEALYNSHEDDPETGPLFRQIGTPCIWLVSLPITRIKSPFDNVGERFVWADLVRCGIATDHGANIESRLAEPLPPDAIIDVVRYENPGFETLTGCSTWHDPIMPSLETPS